MDNNKWRNRDWIWIVGILGISNIYFISVLYNNDKIEANFSIISSAVSIALALVAIFIALKQDSDNQRLTNQMHETLIKVESKLDNMDQKVDKMDPSHVISLLKLKAEDITEIIDTAGEKGLTTEEIKIMIAQQMENLTQEVNRNIVNENLMNDHEKYLLYKLTPLVFERLSDIIIASEKPLTKKEIYRKYLDEHGNIPPDHFMDPIFADVVREANFEKENKIIGNRMYTYYEKKSNN
ncbi:hypothetical protein ACE38F_04540 [Bacillus mycoides]|uniref:hypothetical protein n=1 Tax=Bacillus mycoides TaxID=1405 RepID=UPI0035CA06C5